MLPRFYTINPPQKGYTDLWKVNQVVAANLLPFLEERLGRARGGIATCRAFLHSL